MPRRMLRGANTATNGPEKHVEPLLEGCPVYSPSQMRAALIEFVGDEPAEFWAYFAAYDWVVLCQMRDGLLNLPENWPRFVQDLAWLDPSR